MRGCWQLAERGIDVVAARAKARKAHPGADGNGLAELVCSNSMRGAALANAVGLLKEEMRRAGSLVMQIADRDARSGGRRAGGRPRAVQRGDDPSDGRPSAHSRGAR